MAKPKIDDQFWFDYSYDAVKESIKRLDTAIGRTKTFMAGLLAVFTGSAIFTIEYKDLENPLLILLFGLPYVVVLFGEWHATTSTLPKSVKFDPRIPEDIRDAYVETHDFKSKKLRTQIVISFIATLFVGITLMLGFLIGNRNIMEEKKNTEPYVKTSLSTPENKLLVTGNLSPNSQVRIFFTHYYENDTLNAKPFVFLNSDEGLFFHSFKIDSLTLKSVLNVQWEDQGFKRAIIKEIALN